MQLGEIIHHGLQQFSKHRNDKCISPLSEMLCTLIHEAAQQLNIEYSNLPSHRQDWSGSKINKSSVYVFTSNMSHTQFQVIKLNSLKESNHSPDKP